jgi:arylsulfatase A-like enzyme
VSTEWSDKYKGRFDTGWDALREEIFTRQKQLGIIPADAELTARPDAIQAWDEVPAELKPVLARQVEVYAGFMEHTDHQIGRVIDAFSELGSSMTRWSSSSPATTGRPPRPVRTACSTG